jgi:hypothetical protein
LRQERIAGRAGADLSGKTSDPPEAVEMEPEPAPIEEPATAEAPLEAGTALEAIEEAAGAEPEPVVAEESTVQTVPLPVEAVSTSRPARSRRLVASLLLLALLPLMAYLVFFRSPPVAARLDPVPAETIAPPPSRLPPQVAGAPHLPLRTPLPLREQAEPPSLKVAESAVGLRLVGTRLEAEGDRFRSGQRVTFATRVLGGAAGESIFHVWLRDGKVEQSIPLRLGGASWRTHSMKTLGRPGAWAVEARDEQGRVLARADLTVAP